MHDRLVCLKIAAASRDRPRGSRPHGIVTCSVCEQILSGDSGLALNCGASSLSIPRSVRRVVLLMKWGIGRRAEKGQRHAYRLMFVLLHHLMLSAAKRGESPGENGLLMSFLPKPRETPGVSPNPVPCTPARATAIFSRNNSRLVPAGVGLCVLRNLQYYSQSPK